MSAVAVAVAFGWGVCELSRAGDARTRIMVTGGAILGGIAVQYARSLFLCKQSDPATERRQRPLSKEGKHPYAKSTFDAPGNAPPRVLVAATGSVATVKVPELVVGLRKELGQGAEVKVLLSACGEHMFNISEGYNAAAWKEMQELGCEVLTDQDEWVGYESVRHDSVVHIELRRWADCVVVAPCSAHTLAKLALGLSDNLLTSMLRAWDPLRPVIVAPAMNTVMWEHPATSQHLSTLTTWGYHVISPVSKLLACNEYGNGALANVTDIVSEVALRLKGHLARRAHSGVGSWQRLGFEEWRPVTGRNRSVPPALGIAKE